MGTGWYVATLRFICPSFGKDFCHNHGWHHGITMSLFLGRDVAVECLSTTLEIDMYCIGMEYQTISKPEQTKTKPSARLVSTEVTGDLLWTILLLYCHFFILI